MRDLVAANFNCYIDCARSARRASESGAMPSHCCQATSMRLAARLGDSSMYVQEPQHLRAKIARSRPISCLAQQQGRLLRCGILCAHSTCRVSRNVPSAGSCRPQPVKAVAAASSASSAASSESEGERIAAGGVCVTTELLEASIELFWPSGCGAAFAHFIFVLCHNVMSQYAPCGTAFAAEPLQFEHDKDRTIVCHNLKLLSIVCCSCIACMCGCNPPHYCMHI